MAIARFKDLCLDAGDPGVLGAFWAAALDLELHTQESVKHRMHLDLNVGPVDELTALGATVLDAESFRWTLMADPEGGEFCAFVREGEISQRLYEIGIDTADSAEAAHRIAAWWADVLGARLVDDDSGYSYVDQVPGAPYGSLDFAPVPEPKTV